MSDMRLFSFMEPIKAMKLDLFLDNKVCVLEVGGKNRLVLPERGVHRFRAISTHKVTFGIEFNKCD